MKTNTTGDPPGLEPVSDTTLDLKLSQLSYQQNHRTSRMSPGGCYRSMFCLFRLILLSTWYSINIVNIVTKTIIFLGTSNNIQPMQLVQTPDGQTFIYQPTASAPQAAIDQHQIIHQPAGKNCLCFLTANIACSKVHLVVYIPKPSKLKKIYNILKARLLFRMECQIFFKPWILNFI